MKRKDRKFEKDELSSLFSNAKNTEAAGNALEFLLQEFERSFENVFPPKPNSVKYKELAFNNIDQSHIYFGLDPFSDGNKNTILEAISNNAFSPKDFELLLTSEITRKSNLDEDAAKPILEILSRHFFHQEKEFDEGWASAIINSATNILATRNHQSNQSLSNSIHLSRISLRKFLQSKSHDKQAELILQQIEIQEDISFLCYFIRSVSGDSRRDLRGSSQHTNTFGNHIEDIRRRLLMKARHLADINELMNQAYPIDILWFWWGCDDNENLLKYIERALKSDETALAILSTFVRKYREDGNFDHIIIDDIEAFNATTLFIETAERLKKSQVHELSRFGNNFIEALRSRRKRQ